MELTNEEKNLFFYKREYAETTDWIERYLQSKIFMMDTDVFIVRHPDFLLGDYCPIIDWYVLTDFPKGEREEMKADGYKINLVKVEELLRETQEWLDNFK